MGDFENFNSMHFDVLREIGNIGAGNAVSALAKMLGKKVDMFVPVVNLVGFSEIANFIGGPENIIFGILVNLSGDINGMMMFLSTRSTAQSLIRILLGNVNQNNDEAENSENKFNYSEMELSAFSEIGNILASSYLGSLAQLINKDIKPSVPYLSIDMANAILSVPAIEFGKIADSVLFIESVFATEEENVSGYFILVPDYESFGKILKALGVMSDD